MLALETVSQCKSVFKKISHCLPACTVTLLMWLLLNLLIPLCFNHVYVNFLFYETHLLKTLLSTINPGIRLSEMNRATKIFFPCTCSTVATLSCQIFPNSRALQ